MKKPKYLTFTKEMARAYRLGLKTMTRRVIVPQPPKWAEQAYRDDVHSVFVFDGSDRQENEFFEIKAEQPGDEIILGTTWAVPYKYDDLKPTELRPLSTAHAPRHEELYSGPVPLWSYFDSDEKPDGFGRLLSARFLPGFLRDRMPRETLKIVRVERVQEITEADARMEGCFFDDDPGCPEGFAEEDRPMAMDEFPHLWNTINAKRGYSWDSNPWVIVRGW